MYFRNILRTKNAFKEYWSNLLQCLLPLPNSVLSTDLYPVVLSHGCLYFYKIIMTCIPQIDLFFTPKTTGKSKSSFETIFSWLADIIAHCIIETFCAFSNNLQGDNVSEAPCCFNCQNDPSWASKSKVSRPSLVNLVLTAALTPNY